MIEIKSPEQLAIMREGGHKLASILQQIVGMAQPGVTTISLDQQAEQLIESAGGQPNFKLVPGYDFTLCASVNDQVIHGFPNKRALLPGDILTLDIGMLYQGWNLDHATTILIGQPKTAEQVSGVSHFLKAGQRAVDSAIDLVKPGAHVGDLSAVMQETVESAGYSVIREYTGHGVGSQLHMDPLIPCFGKPGSGPMLAVGMTLAIEIMMNMGRPEVFTLKDGWTVVTKDKSLSAQFEHTVAVVDGGYEILTRR